MKIKKFSQFPISLKNINEHQFAVPFKPLLNNQFPELIVRVMRRDPHAFLKREKAKFAQQGAQTVPLRIVTTRYVKRDESPFAIPYPLPFSRPGFKAAEKAFSCRG